MITLTNKQVNEIIRDVVDPTFPFSAPGRSYGLPTRDWLGNDFRKYVSSSRHILGLENNPKHDCGKRANELLYLAQLCHTVRAQWEPEDLALFAARTTKIGSDGQGHIVNFAITSATGEICWVDSQFYDQGRMGFIPPLEQVWQVWG
jgi:hypothetical protein